MIDNLRVKLSKLCEATVKNIQSTVRKIERKKKSKKKKKKNVKTFQIQKWKTIEFN